MDNLDRYNTLLPPAPLAFASSHRVVLRSSLALPFSPTQITYIYVYQHKDVHVRATMNEGKLTALRSFISSISSCDRSRFLLADSMTLTCDASVTAIFIELLYELVSKQ